MPIHITSGSELLGYRLTADMSAADAGTSMWAFAEKEGYEYFIKCYLRPTFPLDDSPGSKKSKDRKRVRCKAFVKHTQKIEKALKKCGSDNFLVPSVDFFRQDGVYYKVTKKIRSARIDVSSVNPEGLLIMLLSAAYAVKSLHEKTNIVHADIKPENFVLQQNSGRIIANLIDFDAGFFEGHAPEIDSLIGDQRFWPPELIKFLLNRGNQATLSQKIDVFSLGVCFCEFLTGELPEFPSQYDYLGQALLDKAEIRIPPVVHDELVPLLASLRLMLHADPRMRPSIKSVHDDLRALNQQLFVYDNTYLRFKTLIRQSLESHISSLNILPLKKLTNSLFKNRAELKIRGLNIGKERHAPRSNSRYQGRKNA